MSGSAGATSMRTLAVLEGLKGGAALALALGLLEAGPDRLRGALGHLVARLHIGRDHGPFAWLDQHLDHKGVDLVATLCALYAAFRLVESWGLWRNRNWAAWLGILSTAIYLPFDLLALARHAGPLVIVVLVVNLAVIAILALRLGAFRPPPPRINALLTQP